MGCGRDGILGLGGWGGCGGGWGGCGGGWGGCGGCGGEKKIAVITAVRAVAASGDGCFDGRW
jgi:hypothetical protein